MSTDAEGWTCSYHALARYGKRHFHSTMQAMELGTDDPFKLPFKLLQRITNIFSERKLGCGTFGQVYKVSCIKSNWNQASRIYSYCRLKCLHCRLIGSAWRWRWDCREDAPFHARDWRPAVLKRICKLKEAQACKFYTINGVLWWIRGNSCNA